MATLAPAARHPADAGSTSSEDGPWRGVVAVGAALALVIAAIVVGLVVDTSQWRVGAAPFFGAWDLRLGWEVLAPVAMGGAVIVWGPPMAALLGWRSLLLVGAVASVGWALALAVVDGTSAVTAPLGDEHDYLAVLPQISEAGTFVSTFVDRLPEYPIHVRGHPPGPPLAFWTLDRLGLGGTGWATMVVLTGWAAVAPSAMVIVDELAGRAAARRAAPFVVLLPAAVWAATSADALFAGVTAAAAATVIVATGRAGRRAIALAAVGGALWAGALLLTYGAAVLLVVPAAVAVHRRRLDVLATTCAVGLAGLGLVAVAGFSWLDGLAATREQYELGVSRFRPAGYFVWANLAAFAVACGPAVVAGAAHVRGRIALVVGAASLALLLADVSLLSKAEVERIWLPFVPFVAVAAVALRNHVRAWLAASAVTGVAVQVMLRSPW